MSRCDTRGSAWKKQYHKRIRRKNESVLDNYELEEDVLMIEKVSNCEFAEEMNGPYHEETWYSGDRCVFKNFNSGAGKKPRKKDKR